MNLFDLLDAHEIIKQLGTIGVLAILFAETGLLVGILFPGDSLLFIAGLAASGAALATFGVQLSITTLLLAAPVAAIAGSQLGHFLGAKYGRQLFDRPDGRFFNQARVIKTEKWLAKYGHGKALILSRFIPFVRTLINPLAGIVGIPAKKFFIWNCIGAIIWTDGLLIAGFLLGEKLKGSVDKYLLPIVGIIIIASLVPVFIEAFRNWQTRKHLS